MGMNYTAEEVLSAMDEAVYALGFLPGGDAVLAKKRLQKARSAYAETLSNPADSGRVTSYMMEKLADAAAALDKLGRRNQCVHLMDLHAALAAQVAMKHERCTACGRATDAVCDGLDGNGLGCTNALAAQGQGEAVAWQYRRLTDEGWGAWWGLEASQLETVRRRTDCEVRALSVIGNTPFVEPSERVPDGYVKPEEIAAYRRRAAKPRGTAGGGFGVFVSDMQNDIYSGPVYFDTAPPASTAGVPDGLEAVEHADLPPGYRMAARDGDYWPIFNDGYCTSHAFPTRELAALAAWKQAHDRLDSNMSSIRRLAAPSAPEGDGGAE